MLRSKLPGVGTSVFTLMSQLAAEHRAVNLGQGFPDFDPPAELVDAMVEAARGGRNQYAPMAGLAPLREAIAAKTAREHGRPTDPDTEVTVTAGASEAIFDAILAVVDRGDEVLLLDPSYDVYAPNVELAGGRCVRVPLNGEDFSVDWQRVADALSSRTRLVVINSPHNPSGATLGPADLDTLAALLRESSAMVLSDEVYEHMVFDGRQHCSVSGHAELAARAFVVSSFGKTYHCTGWKVGYCIAPPPLSQELRRVHQLNEFCVSTPAQWAFAAMFEHHPAFHRELAAFYQVKRDRFAELLADTALRLLPVPGGYFQLVDYSALSDLPDEAFARELVTAHGVAAIPLSPFYAHAPQRQRLLRLCFAKDDATLAEGARRLAAPRPG